MDWTLNTHALDAVLAGERKNRPRNAGFCHVNVLWLLPERNSEHLCTQVFSSITESRQSRRCVVERVSFGAIAKRAVADLVSYARATGHTRQAS